jgi:dUTP pyrophosphatase
MIKVPYKKLHPDAQKPFKGSEKALGYDLSCVEDNTFMLDHQNGRMCKVLFPMQSHLFHTGIAMEVPDEYGVFYKDRSGLGGKRDIHHEAGCIDPDYRGEYLVKLINLSPVVQRIYAGDRIVQFVFIRRVDAEFPEVDELSNTKRGVDGFGSTGGIGSESLKPIC